MGSGGLPASAAVAEGADPEVPGRAERRRFPPEYKRRIMREADRLTNAGELGAFLRREGLYYSILKRWQEQRDRAELKALEPRKRGRKPDPNRPLVKENEVLKLENRRLRRRMERAEMIIEVQKTISETLGIPLKGPKLDEIDF